MNKPAGSTDEEELFSRRMLTQLLAVVVVSSMFVLALYLVGVVGNARDGSGDAATATTATTAVVAQMPPTVPADAPLPDAADSSSTTATDAGTASSSGADDAQSNPSVATTDQPVATPRIVDVSASDVRADSTDSCGAPTSYQPANAVDSVRDTAWMTSGDGVGTVLTITLAAPSIVSEVGLVPGYDKLDPCTGTDRFDELRRVTAVRWTFDDGTSIDQALSPTPTLQTTSVGVVASRITMTIVSTTDPGVDRLDHTPVSEVAVS